MSDADLRCEECGIRFADTVLYHEHHSAVHGARPPAERGTQIEQTGMPTGSTVREDHPPSPGEIAGTSTSG